MAILKNIFILLLFGTSIANPFLGLCSILVLLILGDRSGAYLNINIAGIPFYVTELVIAGIIINLLIKLAFAIKSKTLKLKISELHPLWYCFYGNSLISFIRGISAYKFLDVMRDFALIYYSVFTHITAYLVKDVKKIRFLGLLLGYTFAFKIIFSLLGIGIRISMVGSANSLYIAFFIAVAFFTMQLWLKKYAYMLPILIIITAYLFQQRVRAAWIAVAVYMLFFAFSTFRFKLEKKVIPISLAVLILGYTFSYIVPEGNLLERFLGEKIYFHYYLKPDQKIQPIEKTVIPETPIPKTITPKSVPKEHLEQTVKIPYLPKEEIIKITFLDRFLSHEITREIRSLFMGISSPNVLTRLWLWTDIIEQVINYKVNFHLEKSMTLRQILARRGLVESRIGKVKFRHEVTEKVSHFLVNARYLRLLNGVPFGEKFVPSRIFWWMWDTKRYDPHNSHISVFYRTGILGLIIYLSLLSAVFLKAYCYTTKVKDLKVKIYMLSLLGCFIVHFVQSLTDITLENAYRGAIFWVVLGLMRSLRQIHPEKPTE